MGYAPRALATKISSGLTTTQVVHAVRDPEEWRARDGGYTLIRDSAMVGIDQSGTVDFVAKIVPRSVVQELHERFVALREARGNGGKA